MIKIWTNCQKWMAFVISYWEIKKPLHLYLDRIDRLNQLTEMPDEYRVIHTPMEPADGKTNWLPLMEQPLIMIASGIQPVTTRGVIPGPRVDFIRFWIIKCIPSMNGRFGAKLHPIHCRGCCHIVNIFIGNIHEQNSVDIKVTDCCFR